LDLLCTQRLDRARSMRSAAEEIDRLLCARREPSRAPAAGSFTACFTIGSSRCFCSSVASIFHVQVLERPIEMLIDGRRVERPRGVAAAVPAAAAALSEGLEADSRGDSAISVAIAARLKNPRRLSEFRSCVSMILPFVG